MALESAGCGLLLHLSCRGWVCPPDDKAAHDAEDTGHACKGTLEYLIRVLRTEDHTRTTRVAPQCPHTYSYQLR